MSVKVRKLLFRFLVIGFMGVSFVSMRANITSDDKQQADKKEAGNKDGEKGDGASAKTGKGCKCDDDPNTSPQCIEVKIPFGRPLNNELIPDGSIMLREDAPSSKLSSSQCLHFDFNLNSYIKSAVTSSDGSTSVVVKRPNGFDISYKFNSGSSVGTPIGNQTSFLSKMYMEDADGNRVTSSPTYYIRDLGEGGKIKFSASSGKVNSIIALNGTVIKADDKSIGIQVIRDSSEMLRQIRSQADGLADITFTQQTTQEENLKTSTSGQNDFPRWIRETATTSIKLYAPSNCGNTGSDGLYIPSGEPHTVWTITYEKEWRRIIYADSVNVTLSSLPSVLVADLTGGTELAQAAITNDYDLNNYQLLSANVVVTKSTGGATSTYNWSYKDSSDGWTVKSGNGLKTAFEERTVNDVNNLLFISRYTKNNTTLSKKNIATVSKYGWGNVTTSQKDYFTENEYLETITDYYTNSGETGKYSNIKSIKYPDGLWEKFDYDSYGRTIKKISSYNNSPFTASESSAIVEEYSYVSLDTDDVVSENDDRARTTTVKILGVTSKTTYNVYKKINAELVEIEEVAANASSTFGTIGNQRTVKVYYAADASVAARGRLKSVTYPDGRLESLSYQYGNFSSAASPLESAFTADDAGFSLCTTLVNGTVDSPSGIADKTTRKITVVDHYGNGVMAETYAFSGGAYQLVNKKVNVFDEQHHVLNAYESNSTEINTTWNCCNKASHTTVDGIQTTYAYDALQRLITKNKLGHGGRANIVTSYTYDSSDRLLSETVSDGGLSLSSFKVYDLAGRVTSETDTSGLVTSYAYTPATATTGEIVTKTLPGGFTEITEKYLDGQIKSVTGSAVVAKYFTYGANADGTTWKKVNTGSAASSDWKKMVKDGFNRVVRIEESAYNNTTLVSILYYNTKGQLIRVAKTGMADTLYVYDDLGNVIRQGLDVDGNGTLDLASADRITDTDTVFAQEDSAWWTVTTKQVFGTADSAAATTFQIEKKRLTGFSSGNVDELRESDIYGNTSVATTHIDRANKTVTRNVTLPYSSVAEQTVIVNGLETSKRTSANLTYTYSYDGLERLTGETDPRTGTSSLAYYTSGTGKNGKVYTRTDAAGNVTTYDYSAATGRLASQKNALNKLAYFDYNSLGKVTRSWGDTDYPTEKVYDDHGRVTQLKTYRNGSGWTANAWPTTTGDADVTSWTYDAASGLVTAKTDAAGKSVNYTYNANGKLATRTWARLNGGTALTTAYGYSTATGELLTVDYSDSTPDISYTYNRAGKLATVADAVGARSFAYNAGFDVASETITGLYGKTLTYSYASNGVTVN